MKKRVGLISILLVFVAFVFPSHQGSAEKLVTPTSPAGSYAPVVNPANPHTWFDKPLDGFKIPLQPYEIVLHGSAYLGIAAIELRITGEPVFTIDAPAPGGKLVTFKHTWTPLTSGRYVLQARTRDTENNWSQTAVVTVIVVESVTPTPTVTSTPTPTVTPMLQTGFTEPVFSPNAIALRASCEPKKMTATIGATDPGGVKVVVVFYRLVDKATGDTTSWANTVMLPLGRNKYKIDLQPVSSSSELRDFAIHQYDVQGDSFAALVQMQFVIQTNSGRMIRSNVYTAATLYYCTP